MPANEHPAAKLCPGSLKADGPCEHGEYDVHPVRSAAYLPVREYTLAVTFRADAVTAMEVKQAMEDTANALIHPTKELAHAVFTRGAEAVVRAAGEERDAAERV